MQAADGPGPKRPRRQAATAAQSALKQVTVADLPSTVHRRRVALTSQDTLEDPAERDAVFYSGRAPEEHAVRTLVVTLHSERRPKHFPRRGRAPPCHIGFPFDDSEAFDEVALRRTLDSMVEAIDAVQDCDRVLFVCQAGINRSSLALCYYCASSAGGCGWRSAKQALVDAKGASSPGWPTLSNIAFEAFLERRFDGGDLLARCVGGADGQSGVLLGDGGMGSTLLVEMGVEDDGTCWSARALMDPAYHATVRQAHTRFLEAGVQVITTSNYAIIPGYLRGKSTAELCDLCAVAGRLAWEAREQHVRSRRKGGRGGEDGGSKDGGGRDGGTGTGTGTSGSGSSTGGGSRRTRGGRHSTSPPILIAGCLPPLVESHQPSRTLPSAQAEPIYEAMARALSPFVDVFLAETMNTVDEALSAANACARLPSRKPVWLSLEGRLLSANADSERSATASAAAAVAFSTSAAAAAVTSSSSTAAGAASTPSSVPFASVVRRCIAEKWPIALLSLNCAGPEVVTAALATLTAEDKRLLAAASIKLGAYANRVKAAEQDVYTVQVEHEGLYRPDLSGRVYCEHVLRWIRESGVAYVAGCCGMMPDHIAALAEEMRASGLLLCEACEEE